MDAVEQAAQIVAARIKALAIEVNGSDPITGTVRWINHGLTIDKVVVGFIFMIGSNVVTIDIGGVTYAVGSFRGIDTPSIGSPVDTEVPSYALDVEDTTTYDALAFIASGALNFWGVDWGQGYRLTGINLSDFRRLTMHASQSFNSVLTVRSYLEPVAPAEINSLLFKKA